MAGIEKNCIWFGQQHLLRNAFERMHAGYCPAFDAGTYDKAAAEIIREGEYSVVGLDVAGSAPGIQQIVGLLLLMMVALAALKKP